MTESQQQKYDQVLAQVVKKVGKQKHVLAVLVAGSYARQELQPGSDIDLVILTDKEEQTHHETRIVVDGIVVECFELPTQHAKEQFKREKKQRRRFISGVVAGGQYVAGDEKLAKSIIKQASTAFSASVPQFNKKERADLLFFLGQSPKQEQLLQKKDKPFAAQLRMNHKLATCLEIAFCLENKVVPHHKYWDEELKRFTDKRLVRLLRQAALEEDVLKRQKAWGRLVQHVVKKFQE